MTVAATEPFSAATAPEIRTAGQGFALAAAVAGFFVVTFDAVVVNVALPSIRSGLGGGITGLQWVVDGYTLMFAALLLWSGSLADRVGARRAFGIGIALFVTASVACGAAPSLGWLVGARFVQGSAAALIMPASLSLVSQAYPDPVRRGRAVAVWALGGSVASTSGPLLGGLATLADWRWIFFVNVPVGAAALVLLLRTARSPQRPRPGATFDWAGQAAAVAAMAGVTFGAIRAGTAGLTDVVVLIAFAVAVLSVAGFIVLEARVRHPMVPLSLFGSRTFRIALGTGFAFMVAYFGLPFLASLYLQGERGLTGLETGVVFVPMMLIGLVLTPFSARIVERFGARRVIGVGLLSMTVGLAIFAALPATAPLPVLALVMVLVGLGGPLTMPPMTAVLLNHVPAETTGVASGVFNTSRQLGGALSVAVFGGPCWPTPARSWTDCAPACCSPPPYSPSPPSPAPGCPSTESRLTVARRTRTPQHLHPLINTKEQHHEDSDLQRQGQHQRRRAAEAGHPGADRRRRARRSGLRLRLGPLVLPRHLRAAPRLGRA